MPEQAKYIAPLEIQGEIQRGSLKKVLLRPTVSASLNLPVGADQEMGNP
jgi:hypothetical protein